MPWKVSDTLDERMRFILAHESGLYSMTELCRQHGISRQNGYKWLARYAAEGLEGLRDRSRAPLTSPQRMQPPIEALLLQTRRERHHWGPRKILAHLALKHPELADVLPAASTVGDLFRRHHLVASRRRRIHAGQPPAPPLRAEAPNQVWTADFKGEFRLGSGVYCYPFTLADGFSRYLLTCQGQRSTALQGVQAALTLAFRTYGLPEAIRTDNGTPFVGHGLTGLGTLGVWWIKLGIQHQRIAPGRPDQNGRHERMHRTMKAETTRPPEENFRRQQARFDRFRADFNHVRPHEALGQRPPATLYTCSLRPFPERLPEPNYPGYSELRKLSHTGHFKFRGRTYFLARPLRGERIGIVEIDDDVWSVRYYNYELARLSPDRGNYFIHVSPMSPV